MTLDEIIKNLGFKKSYLAKMIGISRASFTHRLNGRTAFCKIEIKRLAEIAEIPERLIERTLPKEPKVKKRNGNNRS